MKQFLKKLFTVWEAAGRARAAAHLARIGYPTEAKNLM